MEPVTQKPAFEFALELPGRDSRRLLRALHGQLRAAILDGRLRPGLRLPSTRALAASYSVSRNTAVAAYDLLLGEGYLLTRPGAGVYVADLLPQAPARKAAARDSAAEKRLAPYWRTPLTVPEPVPKPAAPPRFHFRLGVPDKAAFPFEVWRRLSARRRPTPSRRAGRRCARRSPITFRTPVPWPAAPTISASPPARSRPSTCSPASW